MYHSLTATDRLLQSPSHDLDISYGSTLKLACGAQFIFRVFALFNFLLCLYILPLSKILVSQLVTSLGNWNLAGLRLRSKIICYLFDYFYNKIINMENFWLGFVKVLSTH